MNSRFKIIEPKTPAQWENYFQLRYEILRKPWGQSPDTTKDESEDISVHYLVMDEFDDIVGAGRLQLNTSEQGQVRSMAIKTNLQGSGIGSLLLRHIETQAIKKGLKEIILDARENAVEFYLKNGYEITGPSYLLFGIIPHFAMRKYITEKTPSQQA